MYVVVVIVDDVVVVVKILKRGKLQWMHAKNLENQAHRELSKYCVCWNALHWPRMLKIL